MAKLAKRKRKMAGMGLPARPAEKSPGRESSADLWKKLLQAAGIMAVGLWIYWPALNGGWIGDDTLYIAGNPLLHDPHRLWKAWFAPGSFVEYYPIEQTVQWIQWQLWDNDTLDYHLTNVLLHMLSALLVWHLLSKFGLRLAWLGGFFFVAHPMMVDSVALINELKTSLSLPPFLLAMIFWINYEERGRKRDYGLALTFFVVAMLCKITMVMFPVVILLYAWWKRGRIGWNDLKGSAPFFLISLLLGLTTMYAGVFFAHSPGVNPDEGFLWRLALAGQTISFYFSRCFLPITPTPVYFQWTVDPSQPLQFLPWLLWGIALPFLWPTRRPWGRHALLGLGFFFLMLAPFWGFMWISYMKFTWVLEHLLYIPILGLIGLVTAALEQMNARLPKRGRAYGIGVAAVMIAALASESHVYAGMYESEETLCRYIIGINANSWLAHNNLGVALAKKGHLSEADEQFALSLKLNPDYADGHYNFGTALRQAGRVPEAIGQFEQAVKINPDFAVAHYDLGVVLMQVGRPTEAMDHYVQAVRINPDYADARVNLGIALGQAGRVAEAVEQFQHSLRVQPDSVEAHTDLGIALRMTGRVPEAIEQFQQALKFNPDFANAHNNLGIALLQVGRVPEAAEHFEAALQINPHYENARINLARAQALLKNAPAQK